MIYNMLNYPEIMRNYLNCITIVHIKLKLFMMLILMMLLMRMMKDFMYSIIRPKKINKIKLCIIMNIKTMN